MARDRRIDTYIDNAQAFAQPILVHMRELVHRTLPQVDEAIKWGMPHFVLKGKNLIGLAAFKAHVSVVIHNEDRTGEGMGSLGKIASRADLPPDAELAQRILAAAEKLRSGSPVPKKNALPKAELPMPDDLTGALNDAPGAKAHFEQFTAAQRRDYIEWIVSAKREETRRKRIVQTVEWVAEGKRRNWKYESC